MPIHKTPDGKWQWGSHGAKYETREGAEKQAAAAHAHGYKGDADLPQYDTELAVAEAIRDGKLTSPQHYGNIALFAIRISGTGTAYRSANDEFVYRRPENYLSDEFLARCNGLPVVVEHPEKKTLDSQEFADRIVGTVMLPYIKGNEAWGIAKLYDEPTVRYLETHQLSTSPGVVLADTGNEWIEVDGERVLVEGKPALVDHIAICDLGVWDKGGEPSGVISQTTGVNSMTDEERKAAEEKEKADRAKADAEEKEKADRLKADAERDKKLDAILDSVGKIGERVDALEKEDKARKDAARKDESEEERKEREEAEKADKAKKDTEEEERRAKEAEEKEKADKAKADADMRSRIDDLERKIPKELSDADHAAMADCQARADSVAMAFGKSAPRPLNGESPFAYRKRLVSEFKGHSAEYKNVNVQAISDPALFDIAEKRIYADALEAAKHPSDIGVGALREMTTTDRAGRRITRFYGDPDSWMSTFKLPKRRLVGISKGA